MSQLDPYIALRGFQAGTNTGMESRQNAERNRLAIIAQQMEQERMAQQAAQFQQSHAQSGQRIAQDETQFQQTQSRLDQQHADSLGLRQADQYHQFGQDEASQARQAGQDTALQTMLESIAQDIEKPSPASQQAQQMQTPQMGGGQQIPPMIAAPGSQGAQGSQPASTPLDMAKRSAAAQVRALRGMPASTALTHAREMQKLVRDLEAKNAQADALDAQHGKSGSQLWKTVSNGLRNDADSTTMSFIARMAEIEAKQQAEAKRMAQWDPSTPEGQQVFQAIKTRYPKLSDAEIAAQMKLRGVGASQQLSSQTGNESSTRIRELLALKRGLMSGIKYVEDLNLPQYADRKPVIEQIDAELMQMGIDPDMDQDIDPMGLPDQDAGAVQPSGMPGGLTGPSGAAMPQGAPAAGGVDAPAPTPEAEATMRKVIRQILDEDKRLGRKSDAASVKQRAIDRIRAGAK